MALSIPPRRPTSEPGPRRPSSAVDPKDDADGKVEVLVARPTAPVRRPQRPRFRTRRPAVFHRFRRLEPAENPIPAASSSSRRTASRKILEELDHTYPNGIVVEPDGSLVWVESYTLNVIRRRRTARRALLCKMPEGHIPDGLKIDATAISGSPPSPPAASTINQGRQAHRVPGTGGTILNCCFGKGGKLFCCDMGPFDTTGAAMTGRLIEVDVGVEGMPLFRGAIGRGER